MSEIEDTLVDDDAATLSPTETEMDTDRMLGKRIRSLSLTLDLSDLFSDGSPEKKGNFSAYVPTTMQSEVSISRSKTIAKKIVVKNLKAEPNLPENYQEETWEKLKEVVIAIQSSKSIIYTLEEVYQTVVNACNRKMSSQLYVKLTGLTEQYIKANNEHLLSMNTDQDVFLRKICEIWQTHCRQLIMIRSIFLYLDRTYVLQNPTIHSIWDMGLVLFRDHIALNNVVQSCMVDALLQLIERERQGESIDRALLKLILQMLTDLRIYKHVFEEEFLEATVRMYKSESQQRLSQENNISEYLRYVEKMLLEENERLLHYLNSDTKGKLIHSVETELLSVHLQTILQKGLENLIEQNRISDLSLLYTLLSRVENGVVELCAHFTSYIKSKGRTIVMDLDKEKTIVQDLLDLKDKMDNIIESCFEKKGQFYNAVREGFEYSINLRANKTAQFLAKFVDLKLRAGNKETSDEELERMFDKIILLFRYIHGKDIFEAFYKQDLAKRLLLGKSASEDAEKSMLSKLKQECGGGFTTKLEGMFKDMELSKNLNIGFKQHLDKSTVDLSVQVLTMGYWPSYPTAEINIPTQIYELQNSFMKFYLAKLNGRKLQWQLTLGNAVLKAKFNDGFKELQVSQFQAVVLLLFNDNDEISFHDIKSSSGIGDSELRCILQSLACGKTRVLVKQPRGREVADGDVFQFNGDFTNKLFRIKISQVQLKETTREEELTQETVWRDRQYEIDAAIVRIMKMRKSLSHNHLITELFNQLKFPVTLTDLKKRIESLIDRDYIDRDRDDCNHYNYLA